MDFQNEKQHIEDQRRNIEDHRKNRGIWGGLILIMVGSFLFLRNMDLGVPQWVFSWQMILIVIGLLIGIRHNFRGGPWFVLTLLGTVFLLKDMGIWGDFDFNRYGWPLVLVIIGVFMLIRRPYRNRERYQKWKEQYPTKEEYKDSSSNWSAGAYQGSRSADDYLSAVAIFSGDNRAVLSKNFLGGDITAIFGGSDVNMNQADFEGTVVLDVTAVFGGIELIVPANWEVKMEINTIFGGVEDKRAVELMKSNPPKLLVLRGICVFGGIEIKSY